MVTSGSQDRTTVSAGLVINGKASVLNQAAEQRRSAAIFVCGHSKSGKTTTAAIFSEVGIKVISASAVLRSAAVARGWPASNRAELLTAGRRVQAELGEEWFGSELLNAADDATITVFDGIRFPGTIRYLQEAFDWSILLFLDIERSIRMRRFENESDTSVCFAELEAHPHEKSTDSLRELATIRLEYIPPPTKLRLLAEFIAGVSTLARHLPAK